MRLRPRIMTRSSLKRLAVLALLGSAALIWSYFAMIRMPGRSYAGPLPPLTPSQQALAVELRAHVEALATDIGARSVLQQHALRDAEAYITSELAAAGYLAERQAYQVLGVECANIIAELPGRSAAEPVLIVGAHYDSYESSPAANDNASGVAATLALARQFAGSPQHCTVRFVLFVNEEPPFFQTDDMGSMVYARRCRERRENIVGMISLETIGYYSDVPGSQTYPIAPVRWVYPDTGNFIGFVGNYGSRGFLRRAIGAFRKHASFPSEGGALPGWITGVGWSDHWAFWQVGYPAIMLTDTAPFRYPYYHSPQDTAEKLDYTRMARVVEGVAAVIADLAGRTSESP